MSEGNGRTVVKGVSKALKKAVFESLETRQFLSVVTLSTGQGAGGVKLAVDSYGAFGLAATGQATQYQDFTVGDTGIIDKSFVYFTPVQSFLAEDQTVRPSGSLTPVTLPTPTVTAQSATTLKSQFVLSGTDVTGTPFSYMVELSQSLSGPQTTAGARYVAGAPAQFQSVLTQTYRVTNLLGTSTNLGVVRYLAAQAATGGNAPLFAVTNGWLDRGRTLTSVAGDNGADLTGLTTDEQILLARTDFLSVHSYGGTFGTGSITATPLDSTIAANNGLPTGDIEGVTSPAIATANDEFSTSYLPNMAQSASFVVGPRETIEYTTTTTFGEGLPIQALNTQIDTPIATQGDFAFSSSSYNYNFPRDANGTLLPLTVTINRLNGSDNVVAEDGTETAVTLTVSALASSTTPSAGYTISPTNITFAKGQTSATVTLTFNPDAAISGREPSTVLLALSTNSPGASVIPPAAATINLLPTAPVFTFSSPTFAVTEGQGAGQVTIVRSGNVNGATSVLFSTSNGTAIAGQDYSAVSTTVSFADGETSKTISVPIIVDADENNVESVNLSLGGAAATAQLLITDTDASAPFVKSVSTVAGLKGITAVQLSFSESLQSVGSLASFSLFSRTAEGASGSAKLKAISVASASYDPATNSIFVTPTKPLAFNKNYQVSVRPDAGLTDLVGNQLNQSPSTGVASYVGLFSRGTKATYTDRSGDIVTLAIKRGTFEVVRDSSGEAATVSLFGNATSIFSGKVKARLFGTTTIGSLNPGPVLVALPPSFSFGAPNA